MLLIINEASPSQIEKVINQYTIINLDEGDQLTARTKNTIKRRLKNI